MLPFSDSSSNPVIFLSGSGRSGTTWLAEVLSDSLTARLVYEPFKPGVVSSLSPMVNRQYMRPGSPYPEFSSGIDAIVRGRIRSHWTDRYNNRFQYKCRLIKAIRANLFIGWLLEAYPDIKVIHVIRNPMAVIRSQSKGGWSFSLDKYLQQKNLVDDYLVDYREMLEKSTDVYQLGLLHWAIENHVPIKQYCAGKYSKDRFAVFSYEALRDDQAEIKRLMDFAGVPEECIDWSRVFQPSRVSRGKSDFSVEGSDYDSSFDTAYTNEIIERFGLTEWVHW